ncbi:Lysine decarboxylase family [plant metagenome]|uniref:Cytokinin riboside 5'-monophosphate phosphoribohydrolase n=2 Tax=root TaxID=1 RepID=A0A1C3K4P4_9BURK|nr:TIGR00730 family Rossman fold protein [Orrella dioscoreae]SBT26470.1 Lysine decarboxylase family [Orrella dioscoreae]SOE46750.1 Lysine decarboxylase family [Orrella dioscoreae]
MKRKSLCIYCGSNPGRQPVYLEAARELGREMARRGIALVYGGASVGIMGAVADAVLAEGGHVTGIIPESLVKKELAHNGLSEFHVTQSMHERKRMMADLSDGFVALPGGAGTMEELFEIWTWAQLGHHDKPCALYNAGGYYDLLSAFLDHMVAEQFVKQPHRDMLIVANEPGTLLDRLETYEAPVVTKWIGRGET